MRSLAVILFFAINVCAWFYAGHIESSGREVAFGVMTIVAFLGICSHDFRERWQMPKDDKGEKDE